MEFKNVIYIATTDFDTAEGRLKVGVSSTDRNGGVTSEKAAKLRERECNTAGMSLDYKIKWSINTRSVNASVLEKHMHTEFKRHITQGGKKTEFIYIELEDAIEYMENYLAERDEDIAKKVSEDNFMRQALKQIEDLAEAETESNGRIALRNLKSKVYKGTIDRDIAILDLYRAEYNSIQAEEIRVKTQMEAAAAEKELQKEIKVVKRLKLKRQIFFAAAGSIITILFTLGAYKQHVEDEKRERQSNNLINHIKSTNISANDAIAFFNEAIKRGYVFTGGTTHKVYKIIETKKAKETKERTARKKAEADKKAKWNRINNRWDNKLKRKLIGIVGHQRAWESGKGKNGEVNSLIGEIKVLKEQGFKGDIYLKTIVGSARAIAVKKGYTLDNSRYTKNQIDLDSGLNLGYFDYTKEAYANKLTKDGYKLATIN